MTYLITLADIYSGTTIQSNVQASLLYPFIEKAQEQIVLKLLGTAQYDALITAVQSTGLSGLTGANLALNNKLKPVIVNYTWYYATPFLSVRFDNKGLNKLTSDNSSSVDSSKETDLLVRILNFAQESETIALKFLRKYYMNYPLWREDIYYTEDCYLNNRTFFGGIEFDGYLGYDQYIYINGKKYRKGDLL